MSAFFFGPESAQRFGCFHEAQGDPIGAVLFCQSWGPEYQYAHRAVRLAARRLADRGFHVLRFDFSGTGDSWGDTTDASFERFAEDVELAARELQNLSGMRRLDLVGLRLGAAVACTAAASRSDVRRLVLWDPVLDGAAWMTEFDSPSAVRATAGAENALEFAQLLVSERLLHEFAGIGPQSYPETWADSVLVLRTAEAADSVEPPRDGAFQNADVRDIADVAPWVEDSSIWSGQVPVRALNTLVEWLSA